MQTIVYSKEYKCIHPIFDEFNLLYTELSNDDGSVRLFEPLFDSSLEPFEDVFNYYGKCEKRLSYSDKNYPKLVVNKCDKKNIIVAFSGGKDSTATALYYKNKGFNVYLYHVHGLNRFFPYEQQSAERVAEYLEMPLIIDSISLSGKSLYPDHPLKNIIIANMALQWGIKNNIGVRIAFGDYYTACLDEVNFETEGDDCREMWVLYKQVMKKYIPSVKVETPLINLLDTLERLKSDTKLLELTQSCVMTHRFKEKHHNRVQNKYGIKLLSNRCGCCWKCVLEYMYYADHDVLEFNADYYKYCLEVLLKKYVRENNLIPYSIYDLWDTYLLYDIEESKLQDIDRATVYLRRIAYE